MWINRRLLGGIGILLAVSLLPACGTSIHETQQRADIEAEKAKVKLVVDEFKQVWEAKDMELFSRIMVHDPDMVVYGSDAPEHWVGWEPLRAAVEKMFPTFENTKITVREQSIKVHPAGDVAWFSEVWDWDMVLQGKSVRSAGQRLTGVLEKRNGRWVFVQIHNSVPVSGSS